MILMGLLRHAMDSVNMVNAPVIARDRGITISETKSSAGGNYQTLVRVKVTCGGKMLALAGTLFSGKPRLVGIDHVPSGGGTDAAYAVRAQSGQTGFHRPPWHHAGRSENQHRQFHAGPQPAGRGCDLPRCGPMALFRRRSQRRSRALPGVVSAHALTFKLKGDDYGDGTGPSFRKAASRGASGIATSLPQNDSRVTRMTSSITKRTAEVLPFGAKATGHPWWTPTWRIF